MGSLEVARLVFVLLLLVHVLFELFVIGAGEFGFLLLVLCEEG